MSLPFSLVSETVATDISLDGNEGALSELGVVGEKTKNASCSELGDENASCSELRGLQLPGVRWSYMCRWLPGPWVASYGPGARKRPAKPFSTTPERYSARFAQLAIGCSNPASIPNQGTQSDQ